MALYLGYSLALVAVAHWLLGRADADGWILFFGLSLFVLAAAVFAWLLIFPGRIVLNAEGFIVKGGLEGAPWKVFWRDVDVFLIFRLPSRLGSRNMIGFRYKPGARARTYRLRSIRWNGVDEVLPIMGRSAEKVVSELNAFRLRAIAAEGKSNRTI